MISTLITFIVQLFSSRKVSRHYSKVFRFMRLGNQRTPSQPSNLTDEERVLRARLILEETFETVQKGLGLDIVLEPSSDANSAIQYSQIYVKIARPFDIIETVDGCCDISVVNTGTLVAVGIDDLPVLELVDDNNLAKFGPGSSIDQFGKIVKPPNHPPPDIVKELRRQGYRSLNTNTPHNS